MTRQKRFDRKSTRTCRKGKHDSRYGIQQLLIHSDNLGAAHGGEAFNTNGKIKKRLCMGPSEVLRLPLLTRSIES